jgi:hypothetical protein
MKKILALLALMGAMTLSCTTIVQPRFTGKNFTLTVYHSNITDPKKDNYSYYRVYIDKKEAGRTTTGLLSQYKEFSMELSKNRHLVRIEAYYLDPVEKIYKKQNNISQPKPSSIYIDLTKSRRVHISFIIGKGNRATVQGDE